MDTSDQTTCLDPYFASFEESLASKNYKPRPQRKNAEVRKEKLSPYPETLIWISCHTRTI